MTPEIVSFTEGQRIWLVRASGGKHLNNFIHNNVVAISHIDSFLSNWQHSELPSLAHITDFVNEDQESKNKRIIVGEVDDELLLDEDLGFEELKDDGYEKSISAINRINQADTFISKIGVDDLIVTLDKDYIVIGRCSSDAYIGHDVLMYDNFNQSTGKVKVETLEYKLRRAVKWGEPISRSLVGSALRKPLLARNTVSNLDEYWDKVYSLVFPVFTRGDAVYFSNRINRVEAISTRAVSRLFEYVADTQLFADVIVSGTFDFDLIGRIVSGDVFEFDLGDRSTSQAEFMSPGNIYYKIIKPGGVDAKKYAAIFIILLGLGISGCKQDSSEFAEATAGIKSFVFQRDMAEERDDFVTADAGTDLMLRQFTELSNKKKIAGVAKNLKLGIGINKSSSNKILSGDNVKAPKVQSKLTAIDDTKLISDQYDLGL